MPSSNASNLEHAKPIGSAARFVETLRERKKTMLLKLDRGNIGLLNMMVRQPQQLKQAFDAEPYNSEDDGRRSEIRAVKWWLENVVFEEGEKGTYTFPEVKECRVKQKFITRIAQIVDHYKKPLCKYQDMAMDWQDLKDAMEGKTPEIESILEDEPKVALAG